MSVQLVFYGNFGDQVAQTLDYINKVSEILSNLYPVMQIQSLQLQAYPPFDDTRRKNNEQEWKDKLVYAFSFAKTKAIVYADVREVLAIASTSPLWRSGQTQILIQIPPSFYVAEFINTPLSGQTELVEGCYFTDQDNRICRLKDYQFDGSSVCALQLFQPIMQRSRVEHEYDIQLLKELALHPKQSYLVKHPLQGFDFSLFPSNKYRQQSLEAPVLSYTSVQVLSDRNQLNLQQTMMRQSALLMPLRNKYFYDFSHYLYKSLIFAERILYSNNQRQVCADQRENEVRKLFKYVNCGSLNIEALDQRQQHVKGGREGILYQDEFASRRENAITKCIYNIQHAKKQMAKKQAQIDSYVEMLRSYQGKVVLVITKQAKEVMLDKQSHISLSETLATYVRGKGDSFLVSYCNGMYVNVSQVCPKDVDSILQVYTSNLDRQIVEFADKITGRLTLAKQESKQLVVPSYAEVPINTELVNQQNEQEIQRMKIAEIHLLDNAFAERLEEYQFQQQLCNTAYVDIYQLQFDGPNSDRVIFELRKCCCRETNPGDASYQEVLLNYL